MKNLLVRLLSNLLSIICLTLGYRAGYAGIFNVYGLIPPKAISIIYEMPVIILGAYILLLLLSISLGGYIIYKVGLSHAKQFTSQQLIKNLLLSLIAGFTFSFAYWCFLQTFAIYFLIKR